MQNELSTQLLSALATRFKAHPWHGINPTTNKPNLFRAYIETVVGDHMKYEICKKTGYLMVDRPNKFSNIFPALYGFVPQTYCREQVAQLCMNATQRTNIVGDGDPLDICILSDRPLVHGDLLVDAQIIGGFRMIDGGEADEKIVAVLKNDHSYSHYEDISQLPEMLIKKMKHYFLTYKNDPDKPNAKVEVEITETYGRAHALEVIKASQADYQQHFGSADAKLAAILAQLV